MTIARSLSEYFVPASPGCADRSLRRSLLSNFVEVAVVAPPRARSARSGSGLARILGQAPGRTLRFVGTLAVALAASCGGAGRFVPIGTIAVSVPIRAAHQLKVQTEVGSVRLTPSSGDRLSVHADISVNESLAAQFPSADLDRDLTAVVEGDVVTIRSNHLGEREGWRIDLVIEAPPALTPEIVVAVGEVKIVGGGGDVAAHVQVGEIELTGKAGKATLTTTTGAIHVDVAELRGGEFITATGAIEIAVPKTTAAEVLLTTAVGAISVTGAPSVKSSGSVNGGHAVGPIGPTAAGGTHGDAITASATVGAIRFTVRD